MTRRHYLGGIAAGVIALTIAVRPAQAQGLTPVRVPIAVLQRYVGDYEQQGATVPIRLSGDTLFRVGAGGRREVLVPISETVFRLGPVFTTEFLVDETGGVTQVVSDGVAMEFRLPRKGSRPVAPPQVPPVRVPRSVLDRYVGTYEYLPGQMGRTDLRVVVRREGNNLIRVVGGEQVLVPISETRFRVGNTQMVTEFVVDEAGVTQVMGTGFQQLIVRRTSR